MVDGKGEFAVTYLEASSSGTKPTAVEEAYNMLSILVDKEDRNPETLSSPTIFRVPDQIRSSDPGAYTPRRVSIGPLHPELLQKEKISYMHELFTDVANATKKYKQVIVKECTDVILRRASEVRACYAAEETLAFKDSGLAAKMVVDGCFLLQFFRKAANGPSKHGGDSSVKLTKADFIFDNDIIRYQVTYDLVMLENQIPFFVLKELFSLTRNQWAPKVTLPELIFRGFLNTYVIPRGTQQRNSHGESSYDHVLGFLQDECYRPTNPSRGGREWANNLYSARELLTSGVALETGENCYDFTVKTGGSCSLQIPKMRFTSDYVIFMRNLVAYEMFSTVRHKYAKSYAKLMSSLMRTARDVDKLRKARVLLTETSLSTEDVLKLFHFLSEDLVYGDFCHVAVVIQLKDYCNRFWPKLKLSMTIRWQKASDNAVLLFTWKAIPVMGSLTLFVIAFLEATGTIRQR